MAQLQIFSQDVIPVYTSDKGKKVVIGRELHDRLGINTEYKDWFPRMCEYGFTLDVDFSSFLSESTGGRKPSNHILSLDMAKHIAMIQRTEKGFAIRQKLIELEKNSTAIALPQTYLEALKALVVSEESRLLLTQETEQQKQLIEEQKPLVEFADHVGNTKDLITVAEMAKLAHDEDIQIGRNKMFDWLRDSGYLRRNNEPYQTYVDRGYFKVRETIKDTPYGKKVYTQTYVTGKGQIHLIEKLRTEFAA